MSAATCTYREAMRDALRAALAADPRVFLMGEDVGRYGGCYAVSKGLLEEFGEARIRDTPLSESAFTGAGIGAALGGLRPIVEIMTVNFSLLALDQILNNAATLRHMSGGQVSVPLVIRMATGAGRQLAAHQQLDVEGRARRGLIPDAASEKCVPPRADRRPPSRPGPPRARPPRASCAGRWCRLRPAGGRGRPAQGRHRSARAFPAQLVAAHTPGSASD